MKIKTFTLKDKLLIIFHPEFFTRVYTLPKDEEIGIRVYYAIYRELYDQQCNILIMSDGNCDVLNDIYNTAIEEEFPMVLHLDNATHSYNHPPVESIDKLIESISAKNHEYLVRHSEGFESSLIKEE